MMPVPFPHPRRPAAIRLSLMATVLLLVAACNNQYPTTPPDPKDPNLTWAEQYYLKKMRYQQMVTDGMQR